MNSTIDRSEDSRRLHHIGGMGDWLTVHRRQRPDQTALIFEGLHESYAQLDERCNRLAQALASRGAQKGDRVAALLLNGNPFIEALFACAKLGALFVPINYRLSPGEIHFILEDASARVLFYHDDFAATVENARADSPVEHAIIVPRSIAEAGPGDERYESLLEAGEDRNPDVEIDQNDACLMMYTSGTTGRPKGAILSHGNMTWHCVNTLLSPAEVNTDDVVLTVAPLFHIGGLNIFSIPALHRGATVVLHAQFDPVATLASIAQERASMLFMVPAMWQALTQVPDFDRYDVTSLTTGLTGGAACPIPVIEFFQDRGINFIEGFGLTETAPSICVLESKDAVRKNGSVGKPLTLSTLQIFDAEHQPVAAGEIGELVVRGPSVFEGYWNRPEATAEAFANGWFHTGDLARVDEEGFFYIVDRKKDMLISGGENVYPTEVEQVLYRHPSIRDIAVLGVPDERWGEVALAVVVPEPGQHVTLEELRNFCRDQLASFKIPKQLIELDALPRTATGKVLKRELRAQAMESKPSD